MSYFSLFSSLLLASCVYERSTNFIFVIDLLFGLVLGTFWWGDSLLPRFLFLLINITHR